jgi:hypothetical protein
MHWSYYCRSGHAVCLVAGECLGEDVGTLSQTHAGAQQEVARSRQGHAARDGGQVRPKAKLKWGRYVAELVASGEVEIGVHQISEIVPVKGAVFVGPLPAEIQNAAVYSVWIMTGYRAVRVHQTDFQILADTGTALLVGALITIVSPVSV